MSPGASRSSSDLVSSRSSQEGAGWKSTRPADIGDLYRTHYKRTRMSWFLPKILWSSRNDRLAKWLVDPTENERSRWIEAQSRKQGDNFDERLIVSRFLERDSLSFLVLGDTGEGDDSQYHVVRPLESLSDGTSFTYIVSDVIYPSGDVLDYQDKFLQPYRNLPGPIYAIPGNHDWYDGLHGFMSILCNADGDLRPPAEQEATGWKRLVIELLWRKTPRKKQLQRTELVRTLQLELRPQGSEQPAPYFAIELKELLLVGIDTGIRGMIDARQASWLRTISKCPKDKILFSGKPLVVNAENKRVGIMGSTESVNDIVDNPDNRYIGVIGGDTHNYQRYPVKGSDGRVIQHIVSGAGGAYTKATHTIPLATLENCGCDEADFRCYPLRGDSLATYSVLFDRRFGLGKGRFVIPPTHASALMVDRLGGDQEPVRENHSDGHIPLAVRSAANLVYPLSKWSGPFYRLFSEFLDWDSPNPPLFKSFLRIDVRPGELEISCYAVTGCAEHVNSPPLEDHILGRRVSNGRWEWDNSTPS